MSNWDKPGRNFAIMGMARSGTSLASKLISEHVVNAYCMNETEINITKIPALLADVRERLAKGRMVPNRFRGAKLSSDTVRVRAPVEMRIAEGSYDSEAVVGIKMVPEYRAALEREYTVIAIVRDPVYAIASWRQAGDIVHHHVNDDDMDPFWVHHGFKFKHEERLLRQCEIWETYAKQIKKAERTKPRLVDVWRYEGIVALPKVLIGDFAERFGCKLTGKIPALASRNEPSRFYDIKRIREAVEKYCPTRKAFGYA